MKNASPQWKGQNHPLAEALEALPDAVSAQGSANLKAFLEGVAAYKITPYARNMKAPPAIWRHGAARLLEYAAQGTRHKAQGTLLFVPSLINRYYILDLAPSRSLARWLAGKGFETLVLDWGAPGKAEAAYDSAAYITNVLLPAIRFVHETTGKPPVLAGYCMGGVMALAAAQMAPQSVGALALLATPWDFHSRDVAAPRLDAPTLAQLDAWIGGLSMLPPAQLQTLFYWNDPWLFARKFSQFSKLKPGSAAFDEFMALEHWVNDGVALAAGVARDCLIRWGQENVLAAGQWMVDGMKIDPKKLRLPSFIAAPQNDRIVPFGCAAPLAKLLRDCTMIQPSSGHVGMIVGGRAMTELWEPFVSWLRGL